MMAMENCVPGLVIAGIEDVTNSRPQRAETPPKDYWRRWESEPAMIAVNASVFADLPEAPSMTPPTIITGSAYWETEHAASIMNTPAPSAAQKTPVMAAPASTPSLELPAAESIYRILVVENNRSQALFVKSVLHGGSLHAQIETSAPNVLQAINRYLPDLVLMDLHMPEIDGISLTKLIRQYPEHQFLPIVFLSNDASADLQFQILNIGADDILIKPIQPKHLIAAISNRIRRARMQAMRHTATDISTASELQQNGLLSRNQLLQQLTGILQCNAYGGLFFIEITGAPGLRERYGHTAFERLMLQAGQQLVGAAAPHPLTRLNDHSYLLLATEVDPAQLQEIALDTRQKLAKHGFQVRDGELVRLRCAIGYTLLPAEYADTEAALEAVERAALQARLNSNGVQACNIVEQSSQGRLRLLAGELEPAYQPIVSMTGSATAAQYQVLLRLRHTDGTLLPAGQVVPAAEAAGRIADLDQQVMEHALDLLHLYQYSTPPLRLFVSQSARTLAGESYARWLLKSLKINRIDGAMLVIEVRLADAQVHTAALNQCCALLTPMGVSFSVSQFQSGLEAQSLLKQLPLQFVRLAGRYASCHNDPNLREELYDAIAIAKRHGLQVIGQQVEVAQGAAVMRSVGVDLIQGNLVRAVGTDLKYDFSKSIL